MGVRLSEDLGTVLPYTVPFGSGASFLPCSVGSKAPTLPASWSRRVQAQVWAAGSGQIQSRGKTMGMRNSAGKGYSSRAEQWG